MTISDYITLIISILCLLGIIYSVWLYFDIYKSVLVPTKGIIREVNCIRHIVNRHSDDYHCMLTIEYYYNEKLLINKVTTMGHIKYFVGDVVKIYIDKDNPIDITVTLIPQSVIALIIFLTCFFIGIVTIGCKYIDVD